ncbi:hypothetical protein FE257_000862 [Aspergillus nanangensis]|uniref:Amidohydrolase 3 domain-containing protein n=1 Tax=Aspergillus nanangensis TaxID=2582783 RepID=A0AAD4GR19_ASPNN|nr:hypothetical protein FE257_000862 [Aspergillus nanangensis]
MSKHVLTNGRIYTATGKFHEENAAFNRCMVVAGDKITFVGDTDDALVRKAIEDGASVTDLDNRVVVPGIIEAHTHLLLFGTWLMKLDISHCKSLEEIQSSVLEYAKAHPDLPRLLCRGWYQHTTNGRAFATDLDGIDPRPIYIESEDLHSTWCNTAAAKELPIHRLGKEDSPTTVARDVDGNPTGLFAEVAQFHVVWHHQIVSMSQEDKFRALDTVFELYVNSGYTGAIDLAMDEIMWDTLVKYREQKGIPIHVGSHWLVTNGCSRDELLNRVDQVIEMYETWHPSRNPEFCVLGIKLILDGVVDGCTAAVSNPFPGHTSLVPPVWDTEELTLVIQRATDAGMQVAIHAVGDVVITQAIDAIEQAGAGGKRHRMEHIEFPAAEDIRRMGELGIIASIQPGHCDPFAVRTYAQMVGPQLWERAFPYKKFLDGQAVLAIGTDAPSASHLPMPTVYTATTRRSARVPTMTAQTHADQALTLSQAMYAFTAGAAYARHAETWTGSLAAGMRADFVIIDTEWDAEVLLEAKIAQTWSKGKQIFKT